MMTKRAAAIIIVVTLLAAAGAIWWQEAHPCTRYVETPIVMLGRFHSGPAILKRCVREAETR